MENYYENLFHHPSGQGLIFFKVLIEVKFVFTCQKSVINFRFEISKYPKVAALYIFLSYVFIANYTVGLANPSALTLSVTRPKLTSCGRPWPGGRSLRLSSTPGCPSARGRPRSRSSSSPSLPRTLRKGSF